MRTPQIVYEDDQLMVVDKPAKMLVIPAPGKSAKTLTDILNEMLHERGLTVNAHPCHRLDYETSGLMIYAKGKKIQQAVMQQFHQQAVKKKYIAFIQGYPGENEGEIKSDIEGKPAITHYHVLERRRNFSVLEIETITGRTNQIRIQFKQIGCPLVGERRFAIARDYEVKFRRAALHASKISFKHPLTGKTLTFTSSMPEDMQELYNQSSKANKRKNA